MTRLKLYQHVDVAVRAEVVAEHRSKHGQPRDMVPLAERLDGGPVDGECWAHDASMIPLRHPDPTASRSMAACPGRRTKEAVVHGACSIPYAQEEDPETCARAPRSGAREVAVLGSLTSRSGQRTYDHAIREFVAW